MGLIPPFCTMSNFYPRPPRGGRPRPCGAADPGRRFLSTPSARRATGWSGIILLRVRNFYPRPPRGGRLQRGWSRTTPKYFYPRPPRGGRLKLKMSNTGLTIISIHALREEGDLPLSAGKAVPMYFYPRPPRGGRPFNKIRKTKVTYISIHALREEGDAVHLFL